MGPDEEVPREVFVQLVLSFGNPRFPRQMGALNFAPFPTQTLTLGMDWTLFQGPQAVVEIKKLSWEKYFYILPCQPQHNWSSRVFPLLTLNIGLGWIITSHTNDEIFRDKILMNPVPPSEGGPWQLNITWNSRLWHSPEPNPKPSVRAEHLPKRLSHGQDKNWWEEKALCSLSFAFSSALTAPCQLEL